MIEANQLRIALNNGFIRLKPNWQRKLAGPEWRRNRDSELILKLQAGASFTQAASYFGVVRQVVTKRFLRAMNRLSKENCLEFHIPVSRCPHCNGSGYITSPRPNGTPTNEEMDQKIHLPNQPDNQ